MPDSTGIVHHVQELARDLALITNLDVLYRQTVKGMVDSLGFDRASLSLYNPETREVRGTWSTDDWGLVYNDGDRLTFLGDWEDPLNEAIGSQDHLGVRCSGQDWEVLIVLQDGDRIFGWINVDNALCHRPLATMEREIMALCGRTFSTLIQRRQFADLSQKFREQNALKDKLFTIVAHDLRGPIGNIGSLLGLACDTEFEPGDLKKLLAETRLASLRTYNLLENLLNWVRGQIEEVVNLRVRLPVLRPLLSVQNWLEATAKFKKVKLEVNCPENLTVVGDEQMIETIIRNLVSNALKFSPPGKTVLLQAQAAETTISIEVIDQGVGILPERLFTLLESQQKVSQLGTAGESGNGLGLMFSSDLARNLGGRLEAESILGEGSTFRLVLPDALDGEL